MSVSGDTLLAMSIHLLWHACKVDLEGVSHNACLVQWVLHVASSHEVL